MKKALDELSPENLEHFTKATKLFAMKQRLLAVALEEQNRRVMDEKAENVTASLMQILLVDSTKFVDAVFARRSKEIEEMMTPAKDEADRFGKYAQMAEDLA